MKLKLLDLFCTGGWFLILLLARQSQLIDWVGGALNILSQDVKTLFGSFLISRSSLSYSHHGWEFVYTRMLSWRHLTTMLWDSAWTTYNDVILLIFYSLMKPLNTGTEDTVNLPLPKLSKKLAVYLEVSQLFLEYSLPQVRTCWN